MANIEDLKSELQILQRELATARSPERVEYLQTRIRELKLRLFQLGFNRQSSEDNG